MVRSTKTRHEKGLSTTSIRRNTVKMFGAGSHTLCNIEGILGTRWG
jgi:hypothetical protein